MRAMPIEAREEVELAAAAVDDPEAFRLLYERHVRAVYRYCRRRLADPAAAEDATSEVFLKAWQGVGAYRGGSFAAWLIVIARHTVADVLRRQRPAVPLEGAPEPADGARGPEAQAIAATERQALRAAVETLPEEQRAVLELQLAGWRGPEIAEALGKSPAAVKMLRQRALRRLRAQLAEPASCEPERGT